MLITSVDVLVLLVFGMHNIRLLELFVFMLCALIAAIFAYELGVVNPDWNEVGKGFIPRKEILTSELSGAMPHLFSTCRCMDGGMS